MSVKLTSIKSKPLQDMVDKYGSIRKAAAEAGIPYSSFHGLLKKEQEGESLPEGTSTLYDAEGNVKLQWVKQNNKKVGGEAALIGMLEGLKGEIHRIPPQEFKGHCQKDLMNCYVVSDYHLGQLSWGEETGDDWDTEIATEILIKWFSTSVKEAPDGHTGVFCNLGDFLHWDGLEAVTPTSKHVLDADTRFFKLAMTAGKLIKTCISILLSKHERVHVIMAEGNHDLASSVWLKVMLAIAYENEPRVTIDKTPAPYYCFEWGDVSLFFHHGHKKRMAQITKVFAGMYREVFGRTKYSYGHMGHLHHHKADEDNLMKILQHPTLAAKDAHSVRGGYNSHRGAHVITYHKQHGQVKKSTSTPEMVL